MGREEEGVSSLRPELAVIARTLQATSVEVDLLYLCDSEASLNKVSQWIGSGPHTTFVGDANTDMDHQVLTGARTFMIKVKAHQGEPLNKELTPRLRTHGSYHWNVDNGQHAPRE